MPLVNLNLLVAVLAEVVVLRERLRPVEWAGDAVMLAGGGWAGRPLAGSPKTRTP